MELTLHSTDDQLENYALGRLSDTAIPVLEEHLMICALCQERLDEIENFAFGMRDVLREPVPDASGFRAWFSGFDFLKKPAFALSFAAVAMMAITVFVMNGRTKFAPAAALQLSAIRGEMPFSEPARETDLTLIDAPQSGGPFRVEVVDAMGNSQWSGTAAGSPAGVSVKVDRRLAPGDYFVRLYGAGNQVVHEYGFRVRS